jgi:hypothetical protein
MDQRNYCVPLPLPLPPPPLPLPQSSSPLPAPAAPLRSFRRCSLRHPHPSPQRFPPVDYTDKISINVPVVNMVRDIPIMILMRAISTIEGHWKEWALKSRLFWALKWQRAKRDIRAHPFQWPEEWICPHAPYKKTGAVHW